MSASFSPEFFNLFSKPANNKIFRKYGPGLLHNCGPNPCCYEYLNHEPNISGVDLAYDYSKRELDKLKHAFNHKGIIYFYFSGNPQDILMDYKHVMEILAPYVIAIPCFSVPINCDIEYVYNKFLDVSIEYARRMFS